MTSEQAQAALDALQPFLSQELVNGRVISEDELLAAGIVCEALKAIAANQIIEAWHEGEPLTKRHIRRLAISYVHPDAPRVNPK
jgi:hypothetical protein